MSGGEQPPPPGMQYWYPPPPGRGYFAYRGYNKGGYSRGGFGRGGSSYACYFCNAKDHFVRDCTKMKALAEKK